MKTEFYRGQTSQEIKVRAEKQLCDANKSSPNQPVDSKLSRYIGDLFSDNIPYNLTWSIVKQTPHYNVISNFCKLCNLKQIEIMHRNFATLNSRTL